MSDVEMNMAGLIEISNIANEKIAGPMAKKIMASAGDGYRIESTDRSNVKGWARTRVFTDTPAAMRREVRYGTLSKALGGQ